MPSLLVLVSLHLQRLWSPSGLSPAGTVGPEGQPARFAQGFWPLLPLDRSWNSRISFFGKLVGLTRHSALRPPQHPPPLLGVGLAWLSFWVSVLPLLGASATIRGEPVISSSG